MKGLLIILLSSIGLSAYADELELNAWKNQEPCYDVEAGVLRTQKSFEEFLQAEDDKPVAVVNCVDELVLRSNVDPSNIAASGNWSVPQ